MGTVKNELSPSGSSGLSEQESHRLRAAYFFAALGSKPASPAKPPNPHAAKLLQLLRPQGLTVVPRSADAIERGAGPGKPDESLTAGLAADLRELCESFDDAAEFAAFEGTDIRAGQDEFLEELRYETEGGFAERLREFVKPRWVPSLNVSTLPVVPAAVSRLMRTPAESCSAADLEAIARLDRLLTAKLLSVANSAAFGKQIDVETLGGAILRLGVPFARKILWAACCEKVFASAGLRDLWQHSRQVAASAHHIAGVCDTDQEAAYAAGLLHDIGRLLLWKAPGEVKAAEATLMDNGFPLTYAETLLYGDDHAGYGGRLLDRWGIPDSIVEAVTWHHRPGTSGTALAAILCLAESEACGQAQEHLAPAVLRLQALKALGLTGEELVGDAEETRLLATG